MLGQHINVKDRSIYNLLRGFTKPLAPSAGIAAVWASHGSLPETAAPATLQERPLCAHKSAIYFWMAAAQKRTSEQLLQLHGFDLRVDLRVVDRRHELLDPLW